MASTNMKAVVTLTADASGVQAGVNRALAQIDRMQQAVSSLRGLAVAGVAMDFGRALVQMGNQHLEMITNAANRFSPEAMSGNASLGQAKLESDIKLAEAFGPVVGLISEIKAQALRELTDYLVQNKDAIGQAMVNIANFGVAVADISAKMLVSFSTLVNAINDFLENGFGSASSQEVAAGVGQVALGGGPGGAIIGTAIYELLRRKMGGD